MTPIETRLLQDEVTKLQETIATLEHMNAVIMECFTEASEHCVNMDIQLCGVGGYRTYEETFSALVRFTAEHASMREKLDGEPCNDDFQKEAADMSKFADKCLRDREDLEQKIQERGGLTEIDAALAKAVLYDRGVFVEQQFTALEEDQDWDDLYHEDKFPEEMP